ncbi:MAG: alpha/beta hydrolase [Pseudomonadota bacterium]
MNRAAAVLAAGVALSVVATPILAQRSGGGRPSRQCIQEIMNLCGRDRSQIPACLQSKADQLSDNCRNQVASRVRERRGEQAGAFQRAVKPTRTVFYGSDERQQIDVFEPEGAVDELPLVLFVHGGGWRMGSHKMVGQKPAHFGKSEIYFASTGYRVLPGAPVEEQARDVGAALQALRGQAGAIGFDPERIVLMGHSAGAHLAALVASDPQYAGSAFDAIEGVILLDGAGYDVPANIAASEARASEVMASQALNLYREVFSEDPERQRALSPITHVGGEDAPQWLALYVEERDVAKAQAESLVNALNAAGSKAEAVSIANTDHGRMNRELGTEAGSAQTQAVDAFLAEVF